MDAFWVECNPKDVDKEVFPYLNQAEIEESRNNWERGKEARLNKYVNTEHFCFLVSKDLKSIASFPWDSFRRYVARVAGKIFR